MWFTVGLKRDSVKIIRKIYDVVCGPSFVLKPQFFTFHLLFSPILVPFFRRDIIILFTEYFTNRYLLQNQNIKNSENLRVKNQESFVKISAVLSYKRKSNHLPKTSEQNHLNTHYLLFFLTKLNYYSIHYHKETYRRNKVLFSNQHFPDS